MFMVKKFYVVLIALLLLGSLCLMIGKDPAAAAAPGPIYRVDLSQPDSGYVGVSLQVDASQPLTLEMPASYDDLATGLASHIRDEAATDADGVSLPVRRDGNTWYVDGTGTITFSYQVDISGYETGSDYLDSLAQAGSPWPYFPTLTQDLAYIPGYAIFIQPRSAGDLKPDLELTLPSQWKEALPWTEQPASMTQLLSNPLLAGDLTVIEQDSLLVAAPAASAAAAGNGLSEYATKAQALLSQAQSQLGGLDMSQGQQLVLVLLFSGSGSEAETFHASKPFSSCVPLPGGSAEDPLSDSNIEATSGGIVNLLLAQKIDLSSEASWLREGTAWYFQDLLPYQAGIWGSRTFWDRFNQSYNSYLEARNSYKGSIAAAGLASASDGGAATVLTAGGAAACATLDSELHSVQSFNGDLAAFLRALIGIENNSSSVQNDAIESALESMTGRDWSNFFSSYINGRQEIPASSFSSLNVAQGEQSTSSSETPTASTSVMGWILLGIVLGVVFLIPFVFEPYTMRPRKPGFLKKKLGDEGGGEGGGFLKKWWSDEERDEAEEERKPDQ